MEAVAEPEIEVVTLDPDKIGRFKPIPASTDSMALKIEALKALERGVKPEDLAKELNKSNVIEAAEQREVEIEQANEAQLYNRYLRAFLRYSTGQIEGLSTQDMEDVAFLSPKAAVGWEEWKQLRNG